MPTTTLTAQQIVHVTGLIPVYAAPANADITFANDGRVFLEIANTGGAPITCTIYTPRTVDGLDVAENIISIAATSGHKLVGPFPAQTYNQSGGMVTALLSTVATMTIALLRL